MTHYTCKNGDCSTIQTRPGVCLTPGCLNRYRLLSECPCPHEAHHTESTIQIALGKSSLDVVHLGLAIGLVSAVGIFLLGIAATLFGWGESLVSLISVLYIGYDTTIIGSVAGSLWAFVDGFIGGAVIAIIYNWLERPR